ncbi:MAG TPA: DinB family protein [Ignavibacteria bacterium]|nr:DinB family protein [Ignavibacteria bacterium]HRJ99975.1 DinB family protein [Ignavibacteria bacterium]
MKRSELEFIPEYFGNYINELEDLELSEALINYGPDLFRKEYTALEKAGDIIYAENKWTIKQIIQHIIDSERVFLYRALCFARGDKTELPSFDENSYAEMSESNRRDLDELITEFESVRTSGILLYNSFSLEMLNRTGICYNKKISPAAIGFVIAGHTLHHYKVIKDRYIPLI